MKLLVLAQTPPPHHGQSAMVQLLVQGLPATAPDLELYHVNLALSPKGSDIGRWQGSKLFAARRAVRAARAVAQTHGCDTLYYVPAPGKRIALWRDLLILRALRASFPRLVLHWHASGLGAWLESKAWEWEKREAQRALGGADLAIVLADSLAADVAGLRPRQTAIVPNGIVDPFVNHPIPVRAARGPRDPIRVLFIGLGSVGKGLFDVIDAIRHGPANLQLTFAGDFPGTPEANRFKHAQADLGDRLVHAGFVNAEAKRKLLAGSDVLAFPTRYAHEAFPLVLLEALAADLAIVTTRWRAIPEMLPERDIHWVDANAPPTQLADTLVHAAQNPPAPHRQREHFLAHHTTARHLTQLAAALRKVPR